MRTNEYKRGAFLRQNGTWRPGKDDESVGLAFVDFEEGRVRLLWSFAAGDRADGGLRTVHARGGELLIELYGRGKSVGTDLYADDGMTGGDCCPTHFTRATYGWRAGAFHKLTEEIFANDGGHASLTLTN